MDQDFWHERWRENRIGFHQSAANPLLVKHWSGVVRQPQGRVFVPLCGKSLDMEWLLAQGHAVVGVELSELAIEQFFVELGVEPHLSTVGPLQCYRAPRIDLFVGDLFELEKAHLGRVDAVYDRAALVALPSTMRKAYADHLVVLSEGAPQLLITFEYDQDQMPGPPFRIGSDEVSALYGQHYGPKELERADLRLKGLVEATEVTWRLEPK